MSMSTIRVYRPYQDHNKVIECLSQLFPKCFFTNPKQRRPLKANIVDDLNEANELTLGEFNLRAAVDWYIGNIGYEYNVVAGAERIGLDGKVIGKVTEKEAREAQARIAIKHERMNKQRGIDTVRTVQSLHGTGGMTDDQFRKIPAPSKLDCGDLEIEGKLNDAIAALTQARELLLKFDRHTTLRAALMNAAIGVAAGIVNNI